MVILAGAIYLSEALNASPDCIDACRPEYTLECTPDCKDEIEEQGGASMSEGHTDT